MAVMVSFTPDEDTRAPGTQDAGARLMAGRSIRPKRLGEVRKCLKRGEHGEDVRGECHKPNQKVSETYNHGHFMDLSGWWFGCHFFIFPYIGLLIIPIDFHIFQRGGPTTNQL